MELHISEFCGMLSEFPIIKKSPLVIPVKTLLYRYTTSTRFQRDLSARQLLLEIARRHPLRRLRYRYPPVNIKVKMRNNSRIHELKCWTSVIGGAVDSPALSITPALPRLTKSQTGSCEGLYFRGNVCICARRYRCTRVSWRHMIKSNPVQQP